MTFDTVPALLEQGAAVLKADAIFDLSGVTEADSAGLALLIEWLRLARQRGFGLQFRNVPAQLQAIARVSDLEQSLPQLV